MPINPDSLPDDIEALKALLSARDAQLAARDGVERQLRQTIATLDVTASVRRL